MNEMPFNKPKNSQEIEYSLMASIWGNKESLRKAILDQQKIANDGGYKEGSSGYYRGIIKNIKVSPGNWEKCLKIIKDEKKKIKQEEKIEKEEENIINDAINDHKKDEMMKGATEIIENDTRRREIGNEDVEHHNIIEDPNIID